MFSQGVHVRWNQDVDRVFVSGDDSMGTRQTLGGMNKDLM